MKIDRIRRCVFSSFFMFYFLFTISVEASTPTEMAELSLQELLSMSTDEDDANATSINPWSINILYTRRKLDGYQFGSNEISDDEVYFEATDTRSNTNFPVLPTTIIQQAVIVSVNYKLTPKSSLGLSIPYIKQSTDHRSIVPNYGEFNISSQGIGDIGLNLSHLQKSWNKQSLTYSIGVSIPTGSIDEVGDTPRAPGDQQLPYTMQLGSGTLDFPLGLHYQNDNITWRWGANIFAKIRTGKNDRYYRLGNRYSISAWSVWRKNKTIRPTAKISYRYSNKIRGRDDDLIVPGAFPYPAGITNPNYYGGKLANLSLGSELGSTNKFIVFQMVIPIYQYVNGVQPKEVLSINASWNITFN